MIERRKKLRNIESKGACKEIFNTFHTNKMSKSDTSIRCGLKLISTKLALMNEVVRHHMELEFITNNFLNKFFHCVKKNNGSKCFGRVI